MRVLPALAVIGTLVVVSQSPSLMGDARDATARALTPRAEVSAPDQKAYDRLCPLLDVWTDLDADGRQATTRTIRRLARRTTTADPALQAFLDVVPAALDRDSEVRQRSARALLARECRAHAN